MAKSDKMTSISSIRLKQAREHYGLSPFEVCQRIKTIKIEDLYNYESGTDFPSYTKLEALANLYNRPLLYFFFRSEPNEDKLAIAFRSVEYNTGYNLSMQVKTMIEKADLFRLNLSELFNESPPIRFISLLEDDEIDTSEKLLVWLRTQLELPLTMQKNKFTKADSLLEYLRDKLYDIGVYIFKDSFKADNVSGLCLYDEDYPIIMLNNKTSFTRQVFTIFHEIYHLFCGEADVYYPTNSEEKECDKFASHFLIPEDDFQLRLSDIYHFEDESLINKLANEYTVSPAAIAYRLMAQGKITPKFYSTIQEDGIRKVNSATSGGNFYYTRMSYLGRPYLKHVFSSYYSGKINIAAVGKYTGLKTSHISKLSSNMFGGVY